MAGSKKGERRGGAKHGFKKGNRGGPGRPKGSRTSFTLDLTPRVKGSPGKHGKALKTIEKERQIHYLITGQSDILPRDAMLEAMRYFFKMADEYRQLALANAEVEPQNEIQRAKLDAVISECEAKVERYMLLGVDVGYKVAPYLHPRLSAIAVAPQNEKSMDLFALLIEELDESGRQREFKTIEHDAGDGPAN